MKKNVTLLTFMLCLIFVFGLNAKAETYGDYEYTIKNNGTIDITKYDGTSTTLIIPSLINNKEVSSIGYRAFYGCKNLINIVIPNGVKTIGNEAFFDCTKLNRVTIPNTVKTIGTEAFYNCSSLKTVTIPESVVSIGDHAFGYYYYFIRQIIGEGEESETLYMFQRINGFNIKGYKNTEAEKYSDLNSISFTYIPKKDETTTKRPVTDSGKIPVDSTQTVNRNKYVVISASTVRYKSPVSKKITSIRIPKSVKIKGKTYQVTAIAKKAFFNCKNLKTVTIKSPIKRIGEYAFYKCKKLKTVRIYSTKLTRNNVLKGSFKGIFKNAVFYVPKGKKAAYKKILLKRGAKKTVIFKTN